MGKKIAAAVIVLLIFSTFSFLLLQTNAETTSLSNQKKLTTNSLRDLSPAWAPNGSQIAYFAFDSDGWYRHLWSMNTDGSNKAQLTFGSVIDEMGDYSPDGSRIAFIRNVRGVDRSDLMIRESDGSVIQLTNSGLHHGHPKWSNEGTRLVYYYGGAGTNTNEIRMINVQTKQETTLVSNNYPYMNPDWSKDDSKIIFPLEDGIYSVNVNSPLTYQKIVSTPLPAISVAVSPNGNYILCSLSIIGDYQDFYLNDFSSTMMQKLSFDKTLQYNFGWSPNGQSITYSSIASGNADIWTANIIIGSTPTPVITTQKVSTPVIIPSSGKYSGQQQVTINCQTPGAIIRYTTDGTQPTSTSTQYTSPFFVSSTITIIAKAFKTGSTDSGSSSVTYTITQDTAGLSFINGKYCIGVLSYASNNVKISSLYDSPLKQNELLWKVSVPADEGTALWFVCALKDSNKHILNDKNVKFLIDNQLISSFRTTSSDPNIKGEVPIQLSSGIHIGELKFDGDDQYLPSSYHFEIIAYQSSWFNMAEDSYSFTNWVYSLEEHLDLINSLKNQGLISQALSPAFNALYAIISGKGHCFGMAASSAAFYVNQNLKPTSLDTYLLDKNDVRSQIAWYHLIQVGYNNQESISSAFNKIKSLVDQKIPAVLSVWYADGAHSVTVIGYCEDSGKSYLVTYDNNQPNTIVTYCIENDQLLYGSSSVSTLVVVDPRVLPKQYSPIGEIIGSVLANYVALQVHSPVDITVTAENGKRLTIENNLLVKNDFSDSYVFINETKIVLLPSDQKYSFNATGNAAGNVSVDCTYAVGDNLCVNQFKNIEVTLGSELYLNSIQSNVLQVNSGANQGTTENIQAEAYSKSFSSLGGQNSLFGQYWLILAIGVIVIICLLVVLVVGLKVRKKSRAFET